MFKYKSAAQEIEDAFVQFHDDFVYQQDKTQEQQIAEAVECLANAKKCLSGSAFERDVAKLISKLAGEGDEFEHGYQDPELPPQFQDSLAIKILAQNEFQLPLEDLVDKLGWHDTDPFEILEGRGPKYEELSDQLRGYFTIQHHAGTDRPWVILNHKGSQILHNYTQEANEEPPTRYDVVDNETGDMAGLSIDRDRAQAIADKMNLENDTHQFEVVESRGPNVEGPHPYFDAEDEDEGYAKDGKCNCGCSKCSCADSKKKVKNPGKTKDEKEIYRHYGYDCSFVDDADYKQIQEYVSNEVTTPEQRIEIVNQLPDKYLGDFLVGESYMYKWSPEVIDAIVDKLQGNLPPPHHYRDDPEIHRAVIEGLKKYKSIDEIRNYFKDILEYRRVTDQPEGDKTWEESAEADDESYWEDD